MTYVNIEAYFMLYFLCIMSINILIKHWHINLYSVKNNVYDIQVNLSGPFKLKQCYQPVWFLISRKSCQS